MCVCVCVHACVHVCECIRVSVCLPLCLCNCIRLHCNVCCEKCYAHLSCRKYKKNNNYSCLHTHKINLTAPFLLNTRHPTHLHTNQVLINLRLQADKMIVHTPCVNLQEILQEFVQNYTTRVFICCLKIHCQNHSSDNHIF